MQKFFLISSWLSVDIITDLLSVLLLRQLDWIQILAQTLGPISPVWVSFPQWRDLRSKLIPETSAVYVREVFFPNNQKQKRLMETSLRAPGVTVGAAAAGGDVCQGDKRWGEGQQAAEYTNVHMHTGWGVWRDLRWRRLISPLRITLCPAAATSVYFSICHTAGWPSSPQITATCAGLRKKKAVSM